MNNYVKDRLFHVAGILSTLLGLTILLAIFVILLMQGVQRLSFDFLSNLTSRFATQAGILPALAGSLWIFVLTALFALPIGISAALYLEEYGDSRRRLDRLLEVNIANLAGVPSIIYGLLGLGIFVQTLHLGKNLLAGGITLALLVLPIIIVSTREAIRSVPKSIREAAYTMGATKWQTTWHQVLPAASGGIVTGIILALARALGETAPLLVIGGVTYINFVPTSPLDHFTVLPLQIFKWIGEPDKDFHIDAAAAILVLLFNTFLLNAIAIYLRYRWQKHLRY